MEFNATTTAKVTQAYQTLAAEAENIKVTNGYITVNAGAKVNGLEVSNGGAIINGGKVSGITLSGADGCITLAAEAENIKVKSFFIYEPHLRLLYNKLIE